MLLEEVLVTDALAIWPVKDDTRITRALRILDGDFIKPLWDEQGWRPNAPNPGYQQSRKGMPALNMTSGECLQCQQQGFHTITLNGKQQKGICTPLIYIRCRTRGPKELYGLQPRSIVSRLRCDVGQPDCQPNRVLHERKHTGDDHSDAGELDSRAN